LFSLAALWHSGCRWFQCPDMKKPSPPMAERG
jgi:hypothetical protein